MRKRLYLANPYGFSAQQKALLLPPIQQALLAVGAEVWEPFARNNAVNVAQPGWAYRVAQADFKDVQNCDGIFAIVNGTPPDEGVMVELGMAIALHKTIFLFRDDLRRCTDSEQYPLNLMVFAGLPEWGWQDYYYTSIAEIASPDKALYRWLHA
ncbi:nucleoside 2-deoxyribosyltransferase [Kamptonema cortianum]|uniref:Nucleoside 2-deoxyribosyltransferase n=1 Tax=Geitlerinema calcuttense NRMC-F 0142 TaxID=2922238 RepID=A0ABT7M0X0_9CYAN|nr:nucleoside 2-deoxyribosyltransferase [Geitlerinema calcuttense]MDI9637652.1 nucleoside 2-deoxyribosyltransferase [Geitlerinema splendidum]MDK3158286.1 nucleoside 2-deoxyribosyltransferase [Kamptonema cortianum]MDL5057270.1 nucleoside 2-deoxyribosyltransferase [Geitlerinema calcuttense NRMC-F 0142]